MIKPNKLTAPSKRTKERFKYLAPEEIGLKWFYAGQNYAKAVKRALENGKRMIERYNPEFDKNSKLYGDDDAVKRLWERFFAEHNWYTAKGTLKKHAAWGWNPESLIEATRILAQVIVKKNPVEITYEDFCKNRLRGLLAYYNGSPYSAVNEAFPELNIQPWEMGRVPTNYWGRPENRIAAVRWLAEKIGKEPAQLDQKDFFNNEFGGLLDHYHGSPYSAVKEAFPELNIQPWEMGMVPMGHWKLKKNRVKAVKWLVRKTKKEPRDMTAEDFNKNRLGGLLSAYYHSSPYEALLEAGVVIRKDEQYMRHHGPVWRKSASQ